MGFLSAPEIPTTDEPLKYAPSFDTSFITERFQPIIGSTLDLGRKVFRIDRTIGAGAFGDVFQVTDIKKGRQLAAKALPRRTFTHIPSRKNEVVIMSLLYKDATDLFPSVHTILASDDHEFILMELLTLNLDDRFRYAPPSMWQIRFVFRQMLNALDRLRELEICHFDVKPQNIMITSTGRVKLIDFSCAYFDQDVVPQMIMSTTSFIRAPEIVLRYRISHEVDMWSLGITMLKLYLHRAPVFAAVDGLLLSHHEAYMLASWEKTFGPIPDHLIEESVEKNQYYTRSEDGCYKLLPYRRGQVSVNGCKLKTLKPYYMPERKRVDIQRQNAERELFLDLISKVLVYEKRPSSKEALNHPFFDMSKVNKGVTFEETVGHEPEWMMS